MSERFDPEMLEEMSRKELQALAKANGIKANGKVR